MANPPLLLNPSAVPVIGTDAHLPAIAASQLTPEALRMRFAVNEVWHPTLAGDGARLIDQQRKPSRASVLVALVMRDAGLTVLLTKRTDHLKDHAGQISFPGGRSEEVDADVVATALREAEEEVGLKPSFVEVIGTLPAYHTVTSFEVTPVVGLVRPGFRLELDSFEVAEAFEVPLQFLMTPAYHQRHLFGNTPATQRQFLSMPWSDAGNGRGYFIWGATAAMLRNLYHFLAR